MLITSAITATVIAGEGRFSFIVPPLMWWRRPHRRRLDATTRPNAHKIGVVASSDTRALIEQTIDRFTAEVPALKQLKLVVRLELPTHGAGAPIWRVEVPGPKVTKDPAGDAKLDVVVSRSHFNELAKDGRLAGHLDVPVLVRLCPVLQPAVVSLLGNVIQRQLARARA
jgi:hypothetical protein